MARRAGVITVDFVAGTTKFTQDVDTAKKKIQDFGKSGASAMAPTSAALRELEGNFGNNTRAVSRFLASTLGLGPVLKAAFPIVGGLAFGGMIVDLGKKVYDFFKEMEDAPAKANHAFYQSLQSIQTQTDELLLSNAKLENDIAKLEGKRENHLAESLAQARVEADKLNESINRDIESLLKLTKEQSANWFQKYILAESDTSAIAKKLGGSSGVGGYIAQLDTLGAAEQAQLDGIDKNDKNAKNVSAFIRGNFQAQRDGIIGQIRKLYTDALAQAQAEGKSHTIEAYPTPITVPGVDNRELIEKLKHDITLIDKYGANLKQQARNFALQDTVGELRVNGENAKQDRPFNNKLNELKTQYAALVEQGKAIGGTEQQLNAAKANETVLKAIEEINKALEEQHKTKKQIAELDAQYQPQLLEYAKKNAEQQSDNTAKLRFNELTNSIQERIQAQKDLAASIGETYDATREAFVQTEHAKAIKDHANDPEWQKKYAPQLAALDAQNRELFDTQQSTGTKQVIDSIQTQIELEERLAVAYRDGAEAVHKAELAQRALDLSRNHTPEQIRQIIEAEEKLYRAQRQAESNKAVDNLSRQTGDANRIGASVFGGPEAERQAAELGKLAQMRHEGATDAQLEAQAAKDEAEHMLQINREAEQTVFHFRDQLEHLNQIKSAIQTAEAEKKAQGASDKEILDYEIAIREVENQRLHILAQQTLQQRTAQAGVKAFFIEMQTQAKSSAQIIYDSMTSALDGVSSQLANLFTGKKTSFAKMFQDLGTEMEKSVIKSELQKGLGAIGKHFGIDGLDKLAGGTGKPDGTEGNPIWVQFKQKYGDQGATGTPFNPPWQSTGTSDSGESDDSDASKTTGTFGSIFSGVGGFLMNFKGGRAGGGDVDPYSTYVVGEKAPELFTPRTGGTITPLDKANFGRGDTYHNYNIDARGAALGTENRIARTIDSMHTSAIAHSVRAVKEHDIRTPQRKK